MSKETEAEKRVREMQERAEEYRKKVAKRMGQIISKKRRTK